MKLAYRGVSHKRESLTLEVRDSELLGRTRTLRSSLTASYPRHMAQCKPKPYSQWRRNQERLQHPVPEKQTYGTTPGDVSSSSQNWCWLPPSSNFPSQYAYCCIG